VTDAWGIDDRYENASGQERTIPPATIEALRQRIGDRPPPSATAVPVVARRGEPVPGGVADVVLEDGGELRVYRSWPPDLPFGYHRLRAADAGPERRLIVTPGRCHLPTRWRAWGWAVQLYAARSRASWGIGDLADLGRLNRWATEELGAGFVLINPLDAVAPTVPQQPSPYFPASRRFRNPIYLRVEDVPGAELAAAEVEPAAAAGRALNDRREIDRDEVWRLKLGVLYAVWDRTAGGAGCERWWRAQGPALREFCTWCILSEQFGPRWRSWPGGYRHPRNAAVDRFAVDHADRVRFFAWLQWLVEQQLDNATAGLAVIQDLPIGVDPEGADAWAWQDLFAAEVTVGAPPDQFNVKGQDWGLPPFIPWRLQQAGYQPFIDTIRATIPHGGGLRIDHVMGLFRLWWIPAGADPAGGAYVRYPAGDLLDIVALESHRAGAVVVGEDLGTVEAGVRRAMAERALLSYRLLWFEEVEPAGWPEPGRGHHPRPADGGGAVDGQRPRRATPTRPRRQRAGSSGHPAPPRRHRGIGRRRRRAGGRRRRPPPAGRSAVGVARRHPRRRRRRTLPSQPARCRLAAPQLVPGPARPPRRPRGPPARRPSGRHARRSGRAENAPSRVSG
jgi:4-alpha-glucanotransferase